MSQQEFLKKIKDNQNVIYKLVNLYADHPEDKKDLFQEILYQAWKGFPSFKGNSKFATWLYRLSLNTIFTARKKKTEQSIVSDVPEETRDHPVHEGENYQHLLQVIKRLNDIDRAIISMHLDGYENGEISEVLGITTNNVNVKLHRIRQKISMLFKEI